MSTDVVAEYGALEDLNGRFLASPEGGGYGIISLSFRIVIGAEPS